MNGKEVKNILKDHWKEMYLQSFVVVFLITFVLFFGSLAILCYKTCKWFIGKMSILIENIERKYKQ